MSLDSPLEVHYMCAERCAWRLIVSGLHFGGHIYLIRDNEWHAVVSAGPSALRTVAGIHV